MKVKINDDGITAKEVNQYGEKPPQKVKTSFSKIDNFYNNKMESKWQQAESSMRTFEIMATPIFNEDDAIKEYPKWIPGSVHDAVIVADGRGAIKPTVEIID